MIVHMAKKRRKQEEKKEEREYKPPEFDRLDYMRTEVGVSKATIIAALFSMPMALAALFVVPVGGVAGGFLTGLGGMALLWFLLPMVKIDVSPFKWTHWAGVMSTYFLVFLAAWVVLCNPPFSDFATPEIRHVQVSWDDGLTWNNVTTSALGGSLEVLKPANATDMIVRAQVTDNVEVNQGTVMIVRGQESRVMSPQANQYFNCTFTNVVQNNVFTITASDINGNVNEGYSFIVS